jgi:hypothetical protein
MRLGPRSGAAAAAAAVVVARRGVWPSSRLPVVTVEDPRLRVHWVTQRTAGKQGSVATAASDLQAGCRAALAGSPGPGYGAVESAWTLRLGLSWPRPTDSDWPSDGDPGYQVDQPA